MTTFGDNILGEWSFNPPYRFVIMKYVKWDKKQNEVHSVVDDPALAYYLFNNLRNPESILFEFSLLDSFGKMAEDFCKNKFETQNASSMRILAEKK